jgi:GDP-L-fucose synthase
VPVPERLDRGAKTYIAGHRGLVGSTIWQHFQAEGFTNLVGRSSTELDLRDRDKVFDFFATELPQVVVIAAARVGGIVANNTYPVEFLSENLQIQVNLMDAALAQRVPRLLFLGSSCIYPKLAPQPISEDSLLTGPLEPTNDAYAIAKIAGIMQVQAVRREYGLAWISAMPTNLYGPGDNFHPQNSHVLPALIRRFHEAKVAGLPEVVCWGTGAPQREFLYSADLAAAVLHLLEHYDDPSTINVGTGVDQPISELAAIVAQTVGYHGGISWDHTKPDGTPRKLLDVTRIRTTGWEPQVTLDDGLRRTYEWYLEAQENVRQK